MGSVNAYALPAIQERAQTHSFDALIHVGDIAYDMADVSSYPQTTLELCRAIRKILIAILQYADLHST